MLCRVKTKDFLFLGYSKTDCYFDNCECMPVVFHSGREDLYENTLALLRHNRRVSAQRELAEDHKLQKGRLATR